MKNPKPTLNSGFTLAEILTVVTIIAIIATALLLTVNPFVQFLKGYDTVRKSDLSRLKTAFEEYYVDHDCYPDTSVLSQCGSGILAPYLNVIPCDPNTKSPYSISIGDENASCPQKYIIYSSLANKFDAQGDKYSLCPDTVVVNSQSAITADIVKACSGKVFSTTYYGCIEGVCKVVAQDGDPPPSYCPKVYPNVANCNNQCTKRDRKGNLMSQCTLP